MNDIWTFEPDCSFDFVRKPHLDYCLTKEIDLSAIYQERRNGRRGRPPVRVYTLYKRKAEKVKPVDLGMSDGSKPGGLTEWKAALGVSNPIGLSPKQADGPYTK